MIKEYNKYKEVAIQRKDGTGGFFVVTHLKLSTNTLYILEGNGDSHIFKTKNIEKLLIDEKCIIGKDFNADSCLLVELKRIDDFFDNKSNIEIKEIIDRNKFDK